MVRAAADAWLAGEAGFAGMPREELAEHLTTLAWTGLSTAWPAGSPSAASATLSAAPDFSTTDRS